jgi:hypothetical protein
VVDTAPGLPSGRGPAEGVSRPTAGLVLLTERVVPGRRPAIGRVVSDGGPVGGGRGDDQAGLTATTPGDPGDGTGTPPHRPENPESR